MSNTVTINMSLEDRGKTVQKKTQEVQGLNREFERTTKLASQALRSQPKAAGFAGEITNYGVERGATGRTGASARDFANEAQGLGGLVRLYATYAANVFAVGAAFTALRDAMNTTNMVEGLNQLGAASGVALGTLAKRFSEVSGGAISLRESMEATTKAISSGLSEQQFLDIGKVAKGASQALGVNMSDAVSRLTRGITKLEPELLDELGIFTKVGKATEDYAKSVGKATGSLTDFERRQAFANAVVAEGLQKFGNIDIPTNPYDKLLATLKNVSQSILETVNVALVPLLSALSSSPTALTAIVAGLGVLIVKQALPAVLQYREGLKSASEDAAKFAERRAEAAKRALDEANKARAAEILAEKDAIAAKRDLRVDEAEKNLRAISKRGISRGVKDILAKPDILSIDDKDLKLLDDLGNKQTNVAGTYRALAAAIREARQANIDYKKTEEELISKQSLPPGKFTAAGIAATQAERARKIAATRGIISAGSEDVAEFGTIEAFKNLGKNVREANLGVLRGAFTRVAGAASILTTAISGIASALSGYLFVVGLVVTGVNFLIDTFSSNKKEQEALTESVTRASEAAKVAADTYKMYGDAISYQSIIAKSNAFTALAASVKDTAEKFKEFESASNFVSRSGEWLKSLFGENQRDVTEAAFIENMTGAIQSISDPKLQKELKDQLNTLFGTTSLSASSLQQAFKDLDNTKFAKIMSQASTELGKGVTRAEALKNTISSLESGTSQINTSFTELSNTLINRDPLSKFGVDLVQQATIMSKALEDPVARIAQLNEIAKDTNKIRMFPGETQASILQAATNFETLTSQVKKYEQEIADSQSRLDTALSALRNPNLTKETREVFLKIKTDAQDQITRASLGIQTANTALTKITNSLNTSLTQSIQQGFKLIELPLVSALSKASIENNKTILSRLAPSVESVKAKTNLDIRAIDVQINQLTATNNLINSIDRLRLTEEKRILEEKMSKETSPQKLENYIKELNILNKQIEQTRGKRFDIKNLTPEEASALAPGMQRDIGLRTQLASLAGQKEQTRITGAFDKVAAEIKEFATSTLDPAIAGIELRKKEFERSDEFFAMSSDDRLKALAGFDRAAQFYKDLKEEQAIQQDIIFATMAKNMARGPGATDVIAAAEKSRLLATQRLEEFRATRTGAEAVSADTLGTNVQLESYRNQVVIAQELLNIEEARFNSRIELGNIENDISKKSLDKKLELGLLSQDEYNSSLKSLNISKAQLDLDKDLYSINKKRTADLTKWTEDFVANGMVESDILAARKSAIIELADIEKQAALNRYAANLKLIELETQSNERIRNFNEFGKNLFEGFGDAIVDFAQTGKWSFGDMVKSMIADLARLEMKMQMTKLYDASGGLGKLLGSVLPAVFGGSSYSGTGIDPTTITGADITAAYSRISQAKGGAFDSGLLKFAKGGAFTNQVVNTPTQFKFAQGAGIMGEAGPEAIMPLQRDNRGNLGVRAQGGGTKVDVVVNNYSSEKAEAKEVVDSRGNRRIEVTVGEMVAAEVSRSNSPVNQSIKNSFGTKPALIRR